MNGTRIESILRKDAKCRSMFLGVFPCDRLPNRFDVTSLLVCNTDPHDAPGQHWVVIYVEGFNNVGQWDKSQCTNYPDRQGESLVFLVPLLKTRGLHFPKNVLAQMKETAMYFYIWNCFQGGSNGCFFKEFRTFAPGTYIHIISGSKRLGGKSHRGQKSYIQLSGGKCPGGKSPT